MACQERNNKKQNEWTQINAPWREDRPQFKLKGYRTIKENQESQSGFHYFIYFMQEKKGIFPWRKEKFRFGFSYHK